MRVDATSDLITGSQVARALRIFGDRGSFLILRDQFLGVHRFEHLRRRIGVARSTLSERLNWLVEAGILKQVRYQTLPVRYEYRLTAKGVDLNATALVSWRWEQDWATDEAGLFPPKLVHRTCGQAMLPDLRCKHCMELVSARDVTVTRGPGGTRVAPVPSRFPRRSKSKTSHSKGVDTSFFHLADVIGDRWTGLVVAGLFFGLHRFDEMGTALSIAPNILSSRLNLLVSAGVVARKPSAQRRVRHEYVLTDKGRELYWYILTLHQWSNKWLTAPREAPLILRHRPCGKRLLVLVTCSECREPLLPGHVATVSAAPATSRRPRVRKRVRKAVPSARKFRPR